MDFKLQD